MLPFPMFAPPVPRKAFTALRIASSFTSQASSTSRSSAHAQQTPHLLSSHRKPAPTRHTRHAGAPATPSSPSTSASHVRMIKLWYCTLAVIQIHATILYVSPPPHPPARQPINHCNSGLPDVFFLLQPSSFDLQLGFPNSFPCHSYKHPANH